MSLVRLGRTQTRARRTLESAAHYDAEEVWGRVCVCVCLYAQSLAIRQITTCTHTHTQCEQHVIDDDVSSATATTTIKQFKRDHTICKTSFAMRHSVWPRVCPYCTATVTHTHTHARQMPAVITAQARSQNGCSGTHTRLRISWRPGVLVAVRQHDGKRQIGAGARIAIGHAIERRAKCNARSRTQRSLGELVCR